MTKSQSPVTSMVLSKLIFKLKKIYEIPGVAKFDHFTNKQRLSIFLQHGN